MDKNIGKYVASRFNALTVMKGGLPLIASLMLSACATYPLGPSMMVLPGAGATFDQFRIDDMGCRNYAQQAGGQSAQEVAQNSGTDSAVVGTVVGAAAGALIGAASGNAAAGAGIGAGSGLLLGSAAGSDAYVTSGYSAQDRYDNAYVQCMYAKGHQVPVPAGLAATQPAPARAEIAPGPRQPPVVTNYPPPGTPPPPGY